MPYVPAGLPSAAYTTTFNAKALENRPVSDPVQDLYPNTQTLSCRQAVKSGSKGKKVKYSFGYWSPVRAYQRGAVSVSLRGSSETWISSDGTSWKYTAQGLPWSYPPSPVLTFQFEKSGVVPIGGVPSVPDANTQNRLITECILKIGDRKADIAESLAESREAITHLAKTVSSLVRALLALRRGNFRAAARALGISKRRVFNGKTVASRWLEYQYAWLPLLSDIYAFSEIARKGLGNKPPILSAVRNLSDSYPWVCRRDPQDGPLSGVMLVNHRCKLFYRLNDATLLRLSQLGLANPLEVAWAVVPFSFVIDWFLPIGNFLEAWTATLGLSYLDGMITSHAEGKAKAAFNRSRRGPGKLISSDFEWIVDQKGIRRIKLTSVGPLLYVKSPFSSTHVTSALALLRQLKR